MNLFATSAVAKGYSEDRPYLHPEIIQKIKIKLNIMKIEYYGSHSILNYSNRR